MRVKEIVVDGRSFTVYENGDIVSRFGNKLKPQDNARGYKYVHLGRRDSKRNYYVHIVVAQCFVDNPLNLPEVNHLDHNRSNNAANNLEWISRLDNIRDLFRNGYGNPPPKKPVNQFSISGELIREWETPKQAADYYGCTKELIQMAAALKNKVISAMGYKWQYKKDYGNPLKKHKRKLSFTV
jgi:hypothetical protein